MSVPLVGQNMLVKPIFEIKLLGVHKSKDRSVQGWGVGIFMFYMVARGLDQPRTRHFSWFYAYIVIHLCTGSMFNVCAVTVYLVRVF